MIHTKNIKFTRYDEEFEATVTWDDQPWSNFGPNTTNAFWKAKLIQPKMIEIKEHRIRADGFLSKMGLYKSNHHFVLIEDDSAEWGDEKIKNIYPWVIDEILYNYYAKDCEAYYRNYVEKVKFALDVKYAKVFKSLRDKKHVLYRRFCSKELDLTTHKILLRPIHKEEVKLEQKLRDRKHEIENRYFSCCRLKEVFQYRPGEVKRCPSVFNEEHI